MIVKLPGVVLVCSLFGPEPNIDCRQSTPWLWLLPWRQEDSKESLSGLESCIFLFFFLFYFVVFIYSGLLPELVGKFGICGVLSMAGAGPLRGSKIASIAVPSSWTSGVFWLVDYGFSLILGLELALRLFLLHQARTVWNYLEI